MMRSRRAESRHPARRRPRGRVGEAPLKTGAAVRSLSWRLGVATLTVTLPLVLATLVIVGWIAHSELFAPSAFVLMAILAGAAVVASLALSFVSSRRLTRQMHELHRAAEQVFVGSPIVQAPTGVREFDELSQAMGEASRLLEERAGRQRRAEDDLRRSEEHFRLLADILPQLVWTAGPDGRVDYTNARRERYRTGGLSNADWAPIIHPDDRRATAAAWLQASETARPYEMEHRLMSIENGYTWHLSRAIPLLDARGAVARWYGTTTDIHDQKLREENVKFLMREVNHRSRNLLAVAMAIARRTVATAKTAREFEGKFSERLLGLVIDQDLLIGQNWRGVPLEALVLANVAPPGAERFAIDGPTILLSPSAAQTLGLALRELFNNARQHGAFSNDRGKVVVSWRIDESGAEPIFSMTWREQGGPAVTPPSVRGFGSVLIEQMVAEGLNSTVALSFEVAGAAWRLSVPLKQIAAHGDIQASPAA
jgi:PAS domain S-box-containing protein